MNNTNIMEQLRHAQQQHQQQQRQHLKHQGCMHGYKQKYTHSCVHVGRGLCVCVQVCVSIKQEQNQAYDTTKHRAST